MRVELDGEPWRALPLAAVVRSELAVGLELDRERLRLVGRELRRARALTAATGTLSRGDRSAASLSAYLAKRHVAPADRQEAVRVLEQVGYVDDSRFGSERAAALAARGYGDAAIRFELEQQGLSAPQIEAAVAPLAPEVQRAAALVAQYGSTPKTARRLAGKGFDAETVESVIGLLD